MTAGCRRSRCGRAGAGDQRRAWGGRVGDLDGPAGWATDVPQVPLRHDGRARSDLPGVRAKGEERKGAARAKAVVVADGVERGHHADRRSAATTPWVLGESVHKRLPTVVLLAIAPWMDDDGIYELRDRLEEYEEDREPRVEIPTIRRWLLVRSIRTMLGRPSDPGSMDTAVNLLQDSPPLAELTESILETARMTGTGEWCELLGKYRDRREPVERFLISCLGDPLRNRRHFAAPMRCRSFGRPHIMARPGMYRRRLPTGSSAGLCSGTKRLALPRFWRSRPTSRGFAEPRGPVVHGGPLDGAAVVRHRAVDALGSTRPDDHSLPDRCTRRAGA